jgi:hypothetical protein
MVCKGRFGFIGPIHEHLGWVARGAELGGVHGLLGRRESPSVQCDFLQQDSEACSEDWRRQVAGICMARLLGWVQWEDQRC